MHATAKAAASNASSKVVRVSGLNRAPIRGSFLVSAYANVNGERLHLGTEAVLSRWSVQYCANCQTHLEVKAFFPLHGLHAEVADHAQYEIEVHTRDGVLGQHQTAQAASPVAAAAKRLFRVEVR